MTFVYSAVALAAALGMLVGAGFGMLGRRWSRETRLMVYRVAVVVAMIPAAFHAYFTYRFATGFTDLQLSPDPIGNYPGAVLFFAVSALLILAAAVGGARFADTWPRVVAHLPAVLFVLYYNLALPMLQRGAPGGGIMIDNMPTVWLFFLCLAATVAFFAFANIAFRTATDAE